MLKKIGLVLMCSVLWIVTLFVILQFGNMFVLRWGPGQYPPNKMAVFDNGKLYADVINGKIIGNRRTLTTNGVSWENITILENTTRTSDPIDLSGCLGYFSLGIGTGNATSNAKPTGSGNGTLTWDFLVGNGGPGGPYVDPSNVDNDIATSFTYNSGDGSNGKDLIQFNPPPCRWLKIRVQNTAGSGNITATGNLTIF